MILPTRQDKIPGVGMCYCRRIIFPARCPRVIQAQSKEGGTGSGERFVGYVCLSTTLKLKMKPKQIRNVYLLQKNMF